MCSLIAAALYAKYMGREGDLLCTFLLKLSLSSARGELRKRLCGVNKPIRSIVHPSSTTFPGRLLAARGPSSLALLD